MIKVVQGLRRVIRKYKEDIDRCNRCAGWHTVGNHGPCENCVNGSNFQDTTDIYCATYEENCSFGMNCNYCREERKRWSRKEE